MNGLPSWSGHFSQLNRKLRGPQCW